MQKKLAEGTWIIAEDYTWTGIARGIGHGVDKNFLEEINSHLCTSDLDFFFDGERFRSGIEQQHQHENNNELMEKVRHIHQSIALKQRWIPINANLSIETIQAQLQNHIRLKFLEKKEKAD